MHILLIEPDQQLADIYTIALLGSDTTIDYAESGQTAMDAIDSHLPDVIILEPELADHDGLEFLHELRSYNDLRDVPVIIHSLNRAYERLADPVPASLFGIQAVLYKPLTSLRELKTAIEV